MASQKNQVSQEEIEQRQSIPATLAHHNGSTERLAPSSLLKNVLERIESAQLQTGSVEQTEPATEIIGLQDSRWEVRALSIYKIGQNPREAELEPIVAALQDEHMMVRAIAAQTLGRFGTIAPLDHLLLALQDRDWEVRERVILALDELARTRLTEVLPLLMAATHDRHKLIRDTAHKVVERYNTQNVRRVESAIVPFMQDIARNRISKTSFQSFAGTMHHFLLVMARQATLLTKNWLAVVGLLFFCYGPVLFGIFVQVFLPGTQKDSIAAMSIMVGIMATIATLVGLTYILDTRQELSMEIELTTPTSLRMILIGRFLLILGTNTLLAILASTTMALLYGQGLWSIVQLWFGPLLLIASLALALSMLISSWLSIVVTALVSIVQTFHFDGYGAQLISHPPFWNTTPLAILLTVVCIGFAIYCMPRKFSNANLPHNFL